MCSHLVPPYDMFLCTTPQLWSFCHIILPQLHLCCVYILYLIHSIYHSPFHSFYWSYSISFIFSIYDHTTAQKIKFSIKDLFSKCDQIHNFLRIWSYLLKKSLIANFIFCAVYSSCTVIPHYFHHRLKNAVLLKYIHSWAEIKTCAPNPDSVNKTSTTAKTVLSSPLVFACQNVFARHRN